MGVSPAFFLFISAFQNFSSQLLPTDLVVLTNLESLNSVLIRQGLQQPERLSTLNDIAITQMKTLLSANTTKHLK